MRSGEYGIKKSKEKLNQAGYVLLGSEIFKITIDTKKYGYSGYEIESELKKNKVYCEFVDDDFVVKGLAALGPEPLTNGLSLEYLFPLVTKSKNKSIFSFC